MSETNHRRLQIQGYNMQTQQKNCNCVFQAALPGCVFHGCALPGPTAKAQNGCVTCVLPILPDKMKIRKTNTYIPWTNHSTENKYINVV